MFPVDEKATEEEGILDGLEPLATDAEPETDESIVVDESAEGASGEEAETEEPPASEEGAEEPPKRRKGVESRIDELVRDREEMRRDRDFFRDMAMQKQPQTPAPEKPAEDLEPKQEDFQSYEEFMDARTDWKVRKATREATEEFKRTQDSERNKAAIEEKFNSARTRIPDFDEVISKTNVTDDVYDIVTGSEQPAELAYFLGKNPAIARRINSLPPIEAAREIGKIEARIQARLKGSSPPANRQINAPPEPQRPLGGGQSMSTKRVEDMSHEEYRAYRAKQ